MRLRGLTKCAWWSWTLFPRNCGADPLVGFMAPQSTTAVALCQSERIGRSAEKTPLPALLLLFPFQLLLSRAVGKFSRMLRVGPHRQVETSFCRQRSDPLGFGA